MVGKYPCPGKMSDNFESIKQIVASVRSCSEKEEFRNIRFWYLFLIFESLHPKTSFHSHIELNFPMCFCRNEMNEFLNKPHCAFHGRLSTQASWLSCLYFSISCYHSVDHDITSH
jgi:hypothetical protein